MLRELKGILNFTLRKVSFVKGFCHNVNSCREEERRKRESSAHKKKKLHLTLLPSLNQSLDFYLLDESSKPHRFGIFPENPCFSLHTLVK